jgi:outer membrane receptor protein involved in Fe transport
VAFALKRTRLIPAGMLTVLAMQQSAAQEYPWQAMPRVEVVGIVPQPGLGIDREQLPYSVQSASGKALAQSQAGNLTDFMARNLSGVNVNEISGSPFQSDITFRGFRASPVLGASQGISVYLDGVRVNEPFGDVVNWDMLPEAAIGNVLLAPGSNPLYGLNTLGGALALTSKSGRSHPGFEAEATAGNRGQRRLDLSHGARLDDNWHTLAAATSFDDAGWREHSDGRVGNLFFKLGHTRGDTEWSVALLAGRSHIKGNGLLSDSLYQEDRRAVYTFPDVTRNQLGQAVFTLRRKLDEGSELSATAYVRNSRRDTVNGDVGDDAGAAILNTTSTRQRSEGAALHWSASKVGHQLGAGATFDRNGVSFAQFEQAGIFSAEREVLADPDEQREPAASVTGSARMAGIYASDTWTLQPGSHLTLSARFNHARVGNTLTNDSGQQAPETFTYRKLNPALGFAQQVGAGATVYANLSQSNRVPTVIELGCADPAQPCRLPVGLQSDPFLEQVVSRTMEAGLRWHGQGAVLSVSLYRTRNQNDILFLSAGPGRQGYFANFERTRHQGLDLSAGRQFGKLEARVSYNLLEAVFDADGRLFTGARNVGVTPGTRMAGLPRHTFKLALDWRPSAVCSLGADMQAISSLVTQGNEDGLTEDQQAGEAPQKADRSIPGHALLNLRASYRIDRHWELFARITNVGDRRYETYGALATDLFPTTPADAGHARFVAPGAPRTMAAGIRASF